MDITVGMTEYGDFEPIRTGDLPVTGKDGYGQPTPTVRELIDILKALPEQFQDLPVARYCDEGVSGVSFDVSFPREGRDDVRTSTPHVRLW